MAIKQELRRQALQARMALQPDEFEALNTALLEHFKRLDFRGVHTVHIFLPIESKREPDTFRFINWLQTSHPDISIIVPKADFNTALMTHHHFRGYEDLKKNAYDILEPEMAQVHEGSVDLVFVPLLAVDLRGYRVGYGKGFYDRFLASANSLKIGVGLEPPVQEIADIHEQDIRLDAYLSPQGLHNF